MCVCRFIAHNGEINTLKGNVNLMHAREGVMSSRMFADDLHKLYPIIEPDMSDSGCFDNVVEFLCYAGHRELPEVIDLTVCLVSVDTETLVQSTVSYAERRRLSVLFLTFIGSCEQSAAPRAPFTEHLGKNPKFSISFFLSSS